MKKFLKKLAKKSFSVFMAVIMLMTCWVWVAPAEPAHAAAQTMNESLATLNSTYFTDAAINSTGASFATPQYNGVSVPSGKHASILKSSNYTNEAWTGTMGVKSALSGSDGISWQWHIPTDTTVLVGGESKATIPVVLSADPDKINVVVAGAWPADSNFALVDKRWYGVRTDAGDIKDVEAMYNQSSEGLAGSTTDNTQYRYSRTKGSGWFAKDNRGKAVQTAGSITVEAGYSGLVSTVPLSFVGWVDGTPKTDFATSSAMNITVVNYTPLKKVLQEAQSAVKAAAEDASGTGKYTDASKEELRKIANQLVAAKPDTTYFNGNSLCNTSGYKTDAEAAINAWNNFGGLVEQYLITWKDDAGNIVDTEYVAAGTTPSHAALTKADTNEYSYTWAGWSPTPYAATKAETYTANFTQTRKAVNITFVDYDGTVISGPTEYIIGATLTIPKDPTRTGYKFKGWTPTPSVAPKQDTTYTATYDKTWTVTFKNYNGDVIKTDVVVEGTSATAPADPSRDPDANYEYVFAGWDNTYTNVTSDITVTATYTTQAHGECTEFETFGATCTTGSKYTKTCNICGYNWEGQEFEKNNALGHSWERGLNSIIVKDKGQEDAHTIKCSVCQSATTTEPHNWKTDSSQTSPTATCTQPGESYFKCDCGRKKTVQGEYGPHNFVGGEAVALEGDVHAYRCTVCNRNDVYGVGSTVGATVACSGGSATCKDLAVCDTCKDTHGDYAAHNFVGGTAVKLDGDVHAYTCKVCAKDGVYGVGTELNATEACSGGTATCSVLAVCDICGDTHGALDPNNHVNKTSVGYIAPKCGVPGYTGKVTCDDCGTVVDAGSAIPALDHEYTNYVSDGNATCTADGTKTALCNHGCGTKNTVADPGSMIPHKYTNYVYNNDAKCEIDGTETAVCDYGCGVGVDTRTAVGTALDHDYTGTVKDNENGTHSFLCNNGCGTYGGTVDCAYDAWTSVDANTHKHTCTVCGYTPAATAHTFGAWTSDDASAADKGTQSRTCTLCSYVDNAECTYKSVFTKATCEDDAYTTYTCTDCGHGYTVIDKGTATGHKFDGAYKFDAENDKHQQACTNENCNAYGVGEDKDAWADCAWTYENTATGTHKATCVCGNTESQACSGGTATCTAEAICQFCKTAYGKKAPHSYTGTVVELEGDKHTYLCVYCSTEGLTGVGEVEGATEDCYGGTATCTEYAKCTKCSDEYGELAPHVYNGTPVVLDGDVHAYRCGGCDNQTLYGVGTELNATEPCSGGSATCTDLAVCDICQDTHGELDADAHKWTAWVNVDGKEEHSRYCEYDNSHTETQECFSSSPAIAAPDCNTAGFTLNTCDDCGHTWQTEPVPALGHDWSEWVSDGEGGHTRTCKRECGYDDNIETGICAENATAVVTDPTCTEQGYTTYTCNDCGYVWVADYTDPLGHDYTEKLYDTEHLKEKANCEHEDIYWYDCSRCDKSAKEETDEKYTDLTFTYGKVREHKWGTDSLDYLKSEATCFAAAKYYKTCIYEDCKKSAKDVLGEDTTEFFSYGSSLEHVWTEVEDEKYLATKADCATDATYYYVCSLCDHTSKADDEGDGETWTDEGSSQGHKLEYTAAKAATCEEAGNLEYWYCSICKKYFKDAEGKDAYLGLSETVIKKISHNLVKVAFKAPTCEENGNPAYEYCTNDGCNYSTKPDDAALEAYKATGHNFAGAWAPDAENNKHSKFCLNGCGKKGLVVDGEQVENATEACTFTYKAETKNGIHTHANACVCGNKTETVFTDEQTLVSTVAPTCTDKGYESHACPVDGCGATWTKNEVAALGHTAGDKATSNGDGTHSVYCTVTGCGYKISTEKCSGGTATCQDKAVCGKCGGTYGETTGHNYSGEWVYQNDAICGVNGTEKNFCTICKQEVTREAAGTALQHVMGDYGYDVPDKLKDILAADGVVIIAPTCKDQGISLAYCKNCDHYKTKIEKKDDTKHQWSDEWTNDGGDCETGITYKNMCTVCGKIQTKVEEGVHEWTLSQFVEPTCNKNGYRKWKCENCSFILEEYYGYEGELPEGYDNEQLSKADVPHVYHSEKVIVAATCTEPAKEISTCINCREEKVEVATGANEQAALNHTKNGKSLLVHYTAKEADCVYEGRLEHWACSKCNAKFLDESAETAYNGSTVIPTVEHKDGNSDGKCDSCGRVLYEAGKSCGCICHKESGLMKFVYKILNFFWKLFKISKTCDCGNVHW